jgi:toxin ParE1/3/4
MRVRFTDTANDEADQLFAHIAAHNPTAAGELARIIEATIARLRSFPGLGAETDVSGVRIIVARPHPYLIFYAIDGDVLVVRNIRHPARRRPPTERS